MIVQPDRFSRRFLTRAGVLLCAAAELALAWLVYVHVGHSGDGQPGWAIAFVVTTLLLGVSGLGCFVVFFYLLSRPDLDAVDAKDSG